MTILDLFKDAFHKSFEILSKTHFLVMNVKKKDDNFNFLFILIFFILVMKSFFWWERCIFGHTNAAAVVTLSGCSIAFITKDHVFFKCRKGVSYVSWINILLQLLHKLFVFFFFSKFLSIFDFKTIIIKE